MDMTGKQLHHIIRMNDFIKAYLAGNSYKKCLTLYSDKNLLLKAKRSEFSLEEAKELAEKYDKETCQIAKENITEQDHPNKNVEELLYDVQYKAIKKALLLEINSN